MSRFYTVGVRVLAFVFVFGGSAARGAIRRAELPVPLDPPYPRLEHPLPELGFDAFLPLEVPPVRSALRQAVKNQSPVRSQGHRGTCSIFSATAWMESYLIRERKASPEVDLSEEWLEHLVVRWTGREGSDSALNFELLGSWGQPTEATLRYVPDDWFQAWKENPELVGRPAQRCGKIERGRRLQACLLGHWDPELLELDDQTLRARSALLARARAEAGEYRDSHWPQTRRKVTVGTIREVKLLLAAGIPLTLDLDFFLGAWNHREAEEKGMVRDTEAWARGEVGYPEAGSVDRKRSLADPSGHSVLAVGYDDEAVIETDSLMQDGSVQHFRYQGVYYFKNSWGTENFGVRFSTRGLEAPGYGAITQRYAHEFGAFYRMTFPEEREKL